MDRADLETLLTRDALGLLREVEAMPDTSDPVALVSKLRSAGHDAKTVSVVLTQASLRRRAEAKFGPFASRMLFTEDGLQQATRLQVAAHHANRFRGANVARVVDLGCGIGADSLAMAGIGLPVLAVDADEVTAAIATYNLGSFPDATVMHARAEGIELGPRDGVWLDPARRRKERGGTRRTWNPDDWSPSLDFAFSLAPKHPLGVKLGPGVAHDLIPADAEAQWVSVNGDVVEACVWAGGLQREGVQRSALVIGRDGTHEITANGPADDAEVGELGQWLHEPNGAVIRARLIGDVGRQLDARMIAPEIAWMTTDEQVESPLVASFCVMEELPLNQVVIKRECAKRGIGTLEIKVRGVDIDPAAFRKRLSLKGDASATLILTRVGERRVAILAERAETQPER